MDWIISISTIISIELMIRKLWYGWALALGNQVLWAILIYQKAAWGLYPLTALMTFQSIRGMFTWLREAQKENVHAGPGQ